jgi:HK97 family phage prohead protease
MQTKSRAPRIERKVEYKPVVSEFKAVGGEGVVEGYLNVKNTEDLVGDVSRDGCFTKTLADSYARKAAHGYAGLWPFLYNHSYESPPCGLVVDAAEDRKGLWIRAELALDSSLGRDVYAVLRQGSLNAMSMGYKAHRVEWTKVADRSVRQLLEVQIMEASTCVFPANTESLVTAVKNQRMGTTMFTRQKDFDTRYATEQLDDWLYADFSDVVSALRAAIQDCFSEGGEPLSNLENEVLPQLANALRGYVQQGVTLGYEPSSSNDYDMMSAHGAPSLKEGRMISQANHQIIKTATTNIMKHVRSIESVLSEAARSSSLQGYVRTMASSSSFSTKEDVDAVNALLGTLATGLEVENTLRETKEDALSFGDLGVDPASRVNAALQALIDSNKRR